MSRAANACAVLLAGWLCGSAGAATVIDNAALANSQDGTDWAAFGRTFSEDHYSPLTPDQ